MRGRSSRWMTASPFSRYRSSSRFGNAAEARVVAQQKIAGVERLLLEGGAVTGDEEPMADHAAQEFDRAKGRKLAAEFRILGICGLGKNKPEAVVPWRFGGIAKHQNQVVAEVDAEARKHAAHLGAQGHERIHNERVWRLRLWFWWARHDVNGLSRRNLSLSDWNIPEMILG